MSPKGKNPSSKRRFPNKLPHFSHVFIFNISIISFNKSGIKHILLFFALSVRPVCKAALMDGERKGEPSKAQKNTKGKAIFALLFTHYVCLLEDDEGKRLIEPYTNAVSLYCHKPIPSSSH